MWSSPVLLRPLCDSVCISALIRTPHHTSDRGYSYSHIHRREMELTFLGTASSCPSKYRNVTALYLDFFERGGMLLDVGEDTLGQMKRRWVGQEMRGANRGRRGLRANDSERQWQSATMDCFLVCGHPHWPACCQPLSLLCRQPPAPYANQGLMSQRTCTVVTYHPLAADVSLQTCTYCLLPPLLLQVRPP